MWSAIKKAINSDLTKPLNTLITEIKTSLDSTLSGKASQTSVDSKASQTSVTAVQTTVNSINTTVNSQKPGFIPPLSSVSVTKTPWEDSAVIYTLPVLTLGPSESAELITVRAEGSSGSNSYYHVEVIESGVVTSSYYSGLSQFGRNFNLQMGKLQCGANASIRIRAQSYSFTGGTQTFTILYRKYT